MDAWVTTAQAHGEEFTEDDWIALVQELARCARRPAGRRLSERSCCITTPASSGGIPTACNSGRLNTTKSNPGSPPRRPHAGSDVVWLTTDPHCGTAAAQRRPLPYR